LTTIALDIRFRVPSGASVAMQNLAVCLVRQAPQEIGFVLVRYREQQLPPELDALDAVYVPKMRGPFELIWNELRLPGLLARKQIDLYHGMKQCAPRWLRCLSVHTVDAIKRGSADDLPLPLAHRLYYAWLVCSIYKRSDHLMPVSGYVEKFLSDDLGIEPGRVTVVSNGVAERFLEAGRSRDDRVHDPLGLKAPYVICVGSVIPLKNQIAAVQALARIADKVPHHLVLLGKEDPVYGLSVREAAEQAGLADRLHHVDFVEPDELVNFLLGADAMVHVSRTEGFCLAAAEGLACGLPMVVTRRGGLPEVCGDAAMYLDDPDDHEALAELLHEVLTDTAKRQTLRARGLERAAALNWPEAARITLGVYLRVLGA
jgi:glycosyltransferase involved in cell wall biosynthesis